MRRKCHVMREAETGDAETSEGVPGLPVAPEGKRRARNGFSPAAFNVAWPCRHLGFNLLGPETVREYISVIVNYPVCGCLLCEP